MEHRKKDDDVSLLLEPIQLDHLSMQQKVFRLEVYGKYLPLYTFTREPTYLNEIDWEKYLKVAIWRENGTLICVGDEEGFSNIRHVCVTLVGPYTLDCDIYGSSDASIAETVTWLCSLKHPEVAGAALRVNYFCSQVKEHCKFDFSSLHTEQLACILESNPKRRFEIKTGTWTAEQSVVLATRSVHLKLANLHTTWGGVYFQDAGIAFLDALEKRQSSFCSLEIMCNMDDPFLSRDNLKRLFRLDIFEKLVIALNCLDDDEELLFLPFSTKVRALDYGIDAYEIEPAAFNTLDITATDLSLKINFHDSYEWEAILISFLNRVASLGHFERLHISACYSVSSVCLKQGILVIQALIGAILANTKLSHLDLSGVQYLFDWAVHFEKIFKAMEVHKKLRTVVLTEYPPSYDLMSEGEDVSEAVRSLHSGDYSPLERLLTRNRNIEVLDRSGRRISNGSTIDTRYEMNCFYNRSTALVKESASLRPLLVATALAESASKNFQYTAVLLSHHSDVLCELVQDPFEEVSQSIAEEATLSSIDAPNEPDLSNRKTRLQPPRAAKRPKT